MILITQIQTETSTASPRHETRQVTLLVYVIETNNKVKEANFVIMY